MHTTKDARTNARHLYRSRLGPGIGLLLLVPATCLALSVATMALAGGAALALFLPLFRRRRTPRATADENCVVLERDQYSRVDDERLQLSQR